MVYRYTKVSLALQAALTAMFLVAAFISTDWFLRGISLLVAAVLAKDLLHCWGAEFTLDDTGLLEKSRFKSRYRVTWDNLNIISKTYVNRRWIMLRGEGKAYYMIKPYIEDYEGLARDILRYLKDHRIKGVVVHEDLLKRLQITDIKLNSEGLMKFE